MKEDAQDKGLKPYGTVLTGAPGVSASRIAEALDVSVATVKRLATPVGRMKLSGRTPFDVYEPELVDKLQSHPEVLKSRERKARVTVSHSAETRRARCVEQLAVQRPELESLYEAVVEKLWSPASESEIKANPRYAQLPAMLWDALAPREGVEEEATAVICNILWMMTKKHQWKVTEWGEQDLPLAWRVWKGNYAVAGNEEIYKNVFVASIRHLWFNDRNRPKEENRERAMERLQAISTRHWQ